MVQLKADLEKIKNEIQRLEENIKKYEKKKEDSAYYERINVGPCIVTFAKQVEKWVFPCMEKDEGKLCCISADEKQTDHIWWGSVIIDTKTYHIVQNIKDNFIGWTEYAKIPEMYVDLTIQRHPQGE